MTNTKEKAGKEERVQIKTRQPGPVQPSGFSQLRRHADLNSVETVAEILSLPTESSAPAEGLTHAAGNTYSAGNTQTTGQTSPLGNTHPTSHTQSTGITQSTGKTRPTGTTGRAGQTRLRGSHRPASATSAAPVSPERDFQKVPNSVTREMAERLFRGKSKQLYDYLWSQSRGAIKPSRTVRRSRPQLLRGAGFGSMGTVERCVEFLVEVQLIKVRTIVGESEGNEYEIFTPEEVAPALLGLPSSTGSTHATGATGSTPEQVVPVAPETGATGSTSNSDTPTGSDGPQTSFKTDGRKPDDEALAPLLAQLSQAAKEITGRAPSSTEAARWRELGELLVTELKIAAGRTTVSNVPAFFTEHLRRRLWKKDQGQLDREGKAVDSKQSKTAKVDASQCPDCFGTGMWYPEGFERGVARCGHEKLAGVEGQV